MSDAVVIGAGLGGLAAAIRLAAAGRAVDLLEAARGPGGKAGTVLLPAEGPAVGAGIGLASGSGVEVDTGPSVLTMPEVFDQLFRLAGSALADEITLRAPTPAFRYLWPDGASLDVSTDVDGTLGSVRTSLGPAAEAELASFLAYGARIWKVAAPAFVHGPPPTFARMMALGTDALSTVVAIDPLRTMWGAIKKRVRDPHLRQLLARYATYNGSDVRRAPATLNCIAHVELAGGGYGVEGGIAALVRALVRTAERLGVRFHYEAPVESIRVDGVVRGVVTGGREIEAPVVVANADAAFVRDVLLPAGVRHGLSHRGDPSMSGWTAVLRAARGEPRVAHTVLFPTDYEAEFADIFDADRPPRDPTVYLCAQEACHGRTGWSDGEPVFVMANAPAEPREGSRPETTWTDLRATVLGRIHGAGLASPADAVVWERTPRVLAAALPGSRGSIYGLASNDAFAAFRRPPNRVGGVPGLYLASGSAHPGGGMPLAALSGRIAAEAAIEDTGALVHSGTAVL